MAHEFAPQGFARAIARLLVERAVCKVNAFQFTRSARLILVHPEATESLAGFRHKVTENFSLIAALPRCATSLRTVRSLQCLAVCTSPPTSLR